MGNFITFVIILAILAGQLIKIPLSYFNGLILLDLTVILLDLILLIKLNFKLKAIPFLFKAAALFIFIMLASLLFSPLKLTLSEYFISFSYIARFSLYLLLAGLFSLSKFEKYKNNLSQSLVLSGILLSITGLIQLIIFPNIKFLEIYGWDPHFYRLVSTWLDPNFLGAYLVLTLILLFQKSFFELSNIKKNILIVIVFLSLVATFSRSSLVMFFISFTLLSVLNKSKKTLLFTLIFSLIFYLGILGYNQAVATPNKINRDTSASYRITTWETGLEIFSKSPLLGAGFNTYRFALEKYNLVPPQNFQSRSGTGNDSSLIFILATTGILGLISFIWFIFQLIRNSINQLKTDRVNKIIFIAGFSGLVVHSLFNNSLFYPPLLLWFLLMAI